MSAPAPAPTGLLSLQVRQGHPSLLDLPWHLPLAQWPGQCARLVEVPRGLSRHEVVFIACEERIYALKELPPAVGPREYELLRGLEERRLPAVRPVGVARARAGEEETAVLITEFLQASLPYRTLFMSAGLERYRDRLLDAMASLLVRLHLGGFFWGDCSLSNVLFRRDAGELQAYAVDAETSELHEQLSPGQRQLDLDILEENVTGGLLDLSAQLGLPPGLDAYAVGPSIRERYERLWAEVNREELIAPGEGFRIQERIRALNELGFSVSEVQLVTAGDGSQLRMRTLVTDRDYHRHLLHNLTGLVAEEKQARLLLNEVQGLKATLTTGRNRSVPLSVAAFTWLNERFHPTLARLQGAVDSPQDAAELYCQVLEHKWFLSEREARDVGLERAVDDYLALRLRERESQAQWPEGL